MAHELIHAEACPLRISDRCHVLGARRETNQRELLPLGYAVRHQEIKLSSIDIDDAIHPASRVTASIHAVADSLTAGLGKRLFFECRVLSCHVSLL